MGELRVLTRADVDLENRTLRIMNSYSKTEKMHGKTKAQNSKRIVHMPTELEEELGDYFAAFIRSQKMIRFFRCPNPSCIE